MENYKLREDEVVLFKKNVIVKDKKGTSELILTNLNVIAIIKNNEELPKEEVTVLVYPIQSIKMYEGKPQVKPNGKLVEIYLLETELEVEFFSKSDLHNFVNATNKLLTGKTIIQRGADKIKETIDVVDETFGINTVQATGNVLKNGITGNISNAFGKIGKIGKALFNKETKKNK